MDKRLGVCGWVMLGLSVMVSGISNYDITLPSYPPGGTLLTPASLNDHNQITGPGEGMYLVPYLWENGIKTQLPFPLINFSGYAGTDINNAGHIASGDWQQQAAIWDGTQIVYLGALGGVGAVAYAINESDQVVGGSRTAVTNQVLPFLWKNGVMTGLGSFGGNTGKAYDINNPGVIVGFCNNASEQARAFIYRNGTLTDLGTLGGSQSTAVAINDANEIVGWSETANGYHHAYVWRNGVMTDLGTLGGNQSQAFDINNRGQILGWAETATGYRPLVVWENGTAVRLNSLIAADSGWELVMPEGVHIDGKPFYCMNNSGAILGTGFVNGGPSTFLMLPRAEPFFMHDSNGDGMVGLQDFEKLSEEWLK